MSQDIVERLRYGTLCPVSGDGDQDKLEAADTIESLRARVAELEALCAEKNGIIQRMKMALADTEALEMGQGEKIAAQALTIKTMREALDNLTQYNSSDKTVSVLTKYVKQGREALALPDNSTEILQEWLDKRFGEPVVIDVPDYHHEAMGCGLEDRGIRDRYEAMEYGWNCAIERLMEQIPDEPLYRKPEIK